MVVGVNGVGKTTTIGKLASQFHKAGNKVVLGAADTFRAAAVDQLILWGNRVGVPVISHGMNTDPASVAYDAVREGVARNADVVIIDTAGRLHTKVNLMNELTKIKKVIPVKYIGVGEKVEDLQIFNRQAFVESLFKRK
jgi:fused signal recognition particle receptor